MTVESVTYITDLDDTYPATGDDIPEGDNHIRNIKTGLGGTFPNFTGIAMTCTEAELNNLDGYTGNTNDLNILSGAASAGVTAAKFQYIKSVTSDIQTQLDNLHAYQLSALGVLAPYKNLVIGNNVTNPNYQVDVDADDVVLEDSSNNKYKASSVNLTVDVAASGANGLDTGSETSSAWYHIWVIYDSTGDTVAGLLSTSATSPSLPGTYDYKGYVGAIYNNGSSNFISIKQKDNLVAIGSTTDLSNGGSTSYASVSLSVPTTARKASGYWDLDNPTGSVITNPTVNFASTSDPVGVLEWAATSLASSSSRDFTSSFTATLIESQTIYYKVSDSGLDLDIVTTGWEY